MGSAKECNAEPESAKMDKIKNMIPKQVRAIFNNKKKEKTKEHETKHDTKTKIEKQTVDKLVENFDKLQLRKGKFNANDELKNFSFKVDDEKELDEFSFKVIEEERKTERTDSQSSHDSGFAEKDENDALESLDDARDVLVDKATDDKVLKSHKDEVLVETDDKELLKSPKDEGDDDKVLESLKSLKIDDKDDKKKKLQTVAVARAPIKNKINYTSHPYNYQDDTSYRQINQVNKHTFTGGHVLVNAKTITDYTEVDVALKKAQSNLPQVSQNPQQQDDFWDIVQELINEDCVAKSEVFEHSEVLENSENILEDFIKNSDIQQDYENLHNFVPNDISEVTEPNAIEEFDRLTSYEQYDNLDLSLIPEDYVDNNQKARNIFPTPPRSENVPSPFSDCQNSFYPTNTPEYTLSPALSSPINSDYEKYQDITPYDELPRCISENLEGFEKDSEVCENVTKSRERNVSTSSMTMKQYKDLQKELSQSFSKKDCCLMTRKSCKDLFQEHIKKLTIEERKSLCVKVSTLDLKTAYGVLHHVLLTLSQGCEQDSVQYALFTLICERVLAQKPQLFADEFGLSLLKSAALRCPSRPLLTRYLVQCARAALKADAALVASKECVFREIDAQGDNLLIACVRRGDECADVLSEIVRREGDETPLFGVHHGNTEGYSALHVACRQHGAALPSLHTVHVLLTHADADLWRGDVKGEDTALHLAVNSPTCELRLVMLLFKHVDRKLWKRLAHLTNRSSVTPLEYARSATKSTTRHNYPQEVLEFLKKCR